MYHDQPPTHIWDAGQTVDLVEYINKQPLLAKAFLDPDSTDPNHRNCYQQKLCLQLLQRTEWMDWMRREGWVILGEKGLRPTEKWGEDNPVAERLKWLQLQHITLCSRLNNYQSVSDMPKEGIERRIWKDYQKKGGFEWYFTYHRLWLVNSPAAQQTQGALSHPLAEAARRSALLKQRIGAGAMIGAQAMLGGRAAMKEEEEGDIEFVDARSRAADVKPAAAGAGPREFDVKTRIPTPPVAQAKPPVNAPSAAARSSAPSVARSVSASSTSTKVASPPPPSHAPQSRPPSGITQPTRLVPAKRERSPSTKAERSSTKAPAGGASSSFAGPSKRSRSPLDQKPPASAQSPSINSPARKRGRPTKNEPAPSPTKKVERVVIVISDSEDEDDDRKVVPKPSTQSTSTPGSAPSPHRRVNETDKPPTPSPSAGPSQPTRPRAPILIQPHSHAIIIPQPPTSSTTASSSTSPSQKRQRRILSPSPDIITPPLIPTELQRPASSSKNERAYALPNSQTPIGAQARSNPARSTEGQSAVLNLSDGEGEGDDEMDHRGDEQMAGGVGAMVDHKPPNRPMSGHGEIPALMLGGDRPMADDSRLQASAEPDIQLPSRPPTPPLPQGELSIPSGIPAPSAVGIVMPEREDEDEIEEEVEGMMELDSRPITPPLPLTRPATPPVHANFDSYPLLPSSAAPLPIARAATPALPPAVSSSPPRPVERVPTPPLPSTLPSSPQPIARALTPPPPPAVPSAPSPRAAGILVPADGGVARPAVPEPEVRRHTVAFKRASSPPLPAEEGDDYADVEYLPERLVADEDAFLAALCGVI